ncbi:MAG TPA: RHS repeat-associated core domain-containing protein [Dokdonella sp.]|uniref:RHS repeat-associated core domain-containing protein n=1 Tax=Dokdonella sp. TaxID=2291710 RepID=UPI002BB7D370|nr:RHS repeat-associated core domain-containing protein [Dokdonella sp.]HUD41942.1 RHS repeat-associated core domain-containing protein [Dokdonella sp.]
MAEVSAPQIAVGQSLACIGKGGQAECRSLEPSIWWCSASYGTLGADSHDQCGSYLSSNPCTTEGEAWGAADAKAIELHPDICHGPGRTQNDERLYFSTIYLYAKDHVFDLTIGFPNPQTGACAVSAIHNGAISGCTRGWRCPPTYELVPDQNAYYCKRLKPEVCTAGNPIQCAGGQKTQKEVDLAGIGGSPLEFARFYSSTGFYSSIGSAPDPQGIGINWRHNWQRSVKYEPAPSGGVALAYVVRPDGDYRHFKSVGGVWAGRNDKSESLIELTTGGVTTGWRYVDASDTVELYDEAGRLQSITTKDGLVTSLSYSDGTTPVAIAPVAGLLIRIQDWSGRSIDLRYDAESFVKEMISPEGSVHGYRYDASKRLTFVDRPGLPSVSREYHYNEAGYIADAGTQQVLLTGVTDENGSRFSHYRYDSSDRAYEEWHGDAEANKLTLVFSGNYMTATSWTRTTDALGQTRRKKFAAVNGILRDAGEDRCANATCASVIASTSVTYDANGNRDQATDYAGTVTDYSYNTRGLETQRIEAATATGPGPAKRTIQTDWHSTLNVPIEKRIYNATSALQARTQWAYNARGQTTATCEIDPADTAAMAYTCSATAAPPIGAKVRRTVMTYCESADVTLGTCPLVGLLLSVNGPRASADTGMGGLDDVTTYTYRAADDPTCVSAGACTYRKGDLWKVTNALGQVVETVSYDKNGRITRSKDANGTLTDFAYHPRGWLATRTVRANASGFPSTDDATTTLAYDAVGNVTRVTQPDGSYLDYGYDAAHRLLTVTDNLGNTLDYCPGGVGTANCLDGAGNRVVEETRNGASVVKRTLRRTYDQLGQLTSQINAQNQATQTWPTLGGYDGNGNPTQVVDGLGVETRQSYDPLNRLTQTIQDYLGPDLATRDTTTGYGYDARDNLVSVTDPDGLATTYTYDGLNDLTGLSSPDTGNTTYTYDAGGNRRTQTDARGIVTTYTYDSLNRLTAISYPTSTLNTSYAYDQPDGTTGCSGSYPAGRLTRITEETGTTTYCYDRRGNVTRKRQLMSATLSLYTVDYAWTKADRLATLTYPSGGIATYTRNAIGQISGITWKANASATPQTLVSGATYYPFGPLNVLTYGNGRTLTRAYDQDYAIDAIQSSHVDGLKMDLTVDVMGNIVNGTDVIGGSPQVTYSYDRLYRLTGSTAGATPIETFTYGPTGDRLSKTVGAGTPQAYTYASGSHRLASVGGVGRSHDANGNLTSAPFASPMGYDDRNRLARLTVGTEKISYHYNGRGERVHKLRDLTREEVLHDESGKRLHSFVQSTSGFGTNAFREYVYLDDVPVATVDAAGIAYLETDHLGTPRVAADPATNAWRWRWNFFGTTFGEHAPTFPASGGIALDLRYPGQAYDAETGLHYNYFRDYEPATGRYIESDPILRPMDIRSEPLYKVVPLASIRGFDRSGYNYVNNSPLFMADNEGLGIWSVLNCYWMSRKILDARKECKTEQDMCITLEDFIAFDEKYQEFVPLGCVCAKAGGGDKKFCAKWMTSCTTHEVQWRSR